MDWGVVRSVVLDNWPYKVAALILAILLWFNVSAEQDRMEQAVSTRLEFEIQDSAWVPVELPRDVRVTFEGRRGEMLSLPFDRPVIRQTVEDINGPVLQLRLDPSMVAYDRQLNVRPIAVRPQEVELRFERMLRKEVPVTLEVEASASEGRTIVGSPGVQPESVTVRGALSEVESIAHVDTDPISLEGLSETTTRQVPVRIPSGLSTVSVDPSQVLVTLQVDSLVERTFSVPVEVRGGSGTLSASPERVEVTVRGPRGVVRALDAREVSASVEVESPLTGPSRFPVEVDLPEGIGAAATADPPLVLVSPAGAEG